MSDEEADAILGKEPYKGYYVTKSQRLAAILHRLRVNDTKHLQEVLRAMKACVLARRDRGHARNELATQQRWNFSRPGIATLPWSSRTMRSIPI